MANNEADISPNEASYLINKLYQFLGPLNVDKALHRHKRSLAVSGPVVSEYTLKNIHPWWSAFQLFFELQKKGKSIKRNLSYELKMLAGDAKKIIALQRFMPKSVQRKYKSDLVDTKRAFDHLFEIQIAWHFYLRGNRITWYEDDGQKHPEFLVSTPNFQFNVECKNISVDIARKIKHDDFHQLVQQLIPRIEKQGYSGNVDIILDDRLNANQTKTLTKEILDITKSKKLKGRFALSFGTIHLKLSEKQGTAINVMEHLRTLRMKLPCGVHAAMFSTQKKGDNLIDPVEITLKSTKPDDVLGGISAKIDESAKTQLTDSIPALIVCFLEDVYDLRSLSSNSGLQLMTSSLLSKKSFSHILGISYCSENQIHKYPGYEVYDNQNLFFRNTNCKFKEAMKYKFINPPG